ncbi:MAG: 50S ribosomal protein L6 [Clostridia bacterium]|nr:50S ribosomal protein L6 [Clostridia bacterium]
MSRIGKRPITIPSGVEVKVDNTLVTVKGPKGTLSQNIGKNLTLNIEGNVLNIVNNGKEKDSNAKYGLYRQLINNMVVGVSEGYKKTLTINGVGYKAVMKGNDVELGLGYSHPILVKAEEGITLSCDKNSVTVSGINKEQVGQFAARIRALRPVEPYHAYGVYYSDEVVRRKEIKSGKK